MGSPPTVFDTVYCVGASLGHSVAPSKGIVTDTDVKMFGTRYLTRMDCKIAPGNSGGGMFAFLAWHFDKWWIVLFSILFATSFSSKESE